MPIFGKFRDAPGLHTERNTNRVRKINIKIVLIAVVAAIVVTGASVLWLVKDANKRILSGKVIDASTDKGISGARINLETTQGQSEIAVTDSEGAFSIDLKEESDTVRFLVRAEGFRRHTGLVRLSPGTTLIEIRIKPI
jgi:hypothetical protein